MKTARTLFAAMAVAGPLVIIAQNIGTLGQCKGKGGDVAVLHRFTAVQSEGVVYINCVSSPEVVQGGTLVLERSTNGIKFEILTFRSTVPSPFEILYSFVDRQPPSGITWYRVRYVGADDSLIHDEVIVVETYPAIDARAAAK